MRATDVTWEEQLKDVGKALAKEKEAEKVISDYQKSVKSTREELADKIENKTAAVLWARFYYNARISHLRQ